MGEQPLPSWEDEPLSRFLHDAQFNERATCLNMPSAFAFLQRLHGAFLCMAGAIEKHNCQNLLVPRLLLVRVHASFLAGVRLALSGQVVESPAVLRVAIENAWYALHIAKDPSPPKLAEIWLRRDENTARCSEEFSIGKVSKTHRDHDVATERDLHAFYNRTVDLGGHPNQMGVLAATRQTTSGSETTYQPQVLSSDEWAIAAALRTAADVAVGGLKVANLIFAERFRLADLDREIDALTVDLNRVFKQYPRAE